MKPRAAAAKARRDLMKMARPAGGFDASRYFRGTGDLGFCNVGTTRMRALAREIHLTHGDAWSIDEAMTFADALLPDRYLEVKAVGVEVVARYRRVFEPRLLNGWKRWLSQGHASNWATTDSICGSLIGPLVLRHPQLVKRVAAWSTDRNMWVRRASAVGLLPAIRAGAALDAAYAVAKTLHADDEDLIQKAGGWMLREAGKVDEPRLERYLRENGPEIPRTTIRYAIERFAPANRQRLLRATMPQR
jgi:3-methyladenine DNA glycosylase AlkD